MKRGTLIWLIIASLLVISGAVISAAALSSKGWDFGKLGTVNMKTNRREITEDFSNISIIADIEDIRILASTDNTASVIFVEEEKQRHSADVINGTLNISFNDTREWYEKIGVFSTKGPSITIYLPKTSYDALSIDSDTSDILLPKGFTFNSIKIKNSTGDIEMTDSTVGTLELTTTTGDMEIENITCADDIKIGVSTGDVELSNVTCRSLYSTGDTGEMEMQNVIAQNTFNITRTTGDVGLDACDAAEITVTTDTGDVSGSLKSGKIFVTSTDTGIVKVPKTSSGGKCEITTDTGNIIFSMHN